MRGRHPKPAHLRQNRTRKPGRADLAPHDGAPVPAIPNPDKRKWHPLTLKAWEHAWTSPMASQWIESDADALGRLAILWDAFYQSGRPNLLAEIRLQESRFGLSPLDRSRLQWEVRRAEEPAQKRTEAPRRTSINDPRRALMSVVKR